MEAGKALLKDFFQIIVIVFFSGCFYAGTKMSLDDIKATQDEMKKDDKEYRKDFSTRLQSLEVRQTTTELMLKDLSERINHQTR